MNKDHASACSPNAAITAALKPPQSARMLQGCSRGHGLEVDGSTVAVPFDSHPHRQRRHAHRTLVAMPAFHAKGAEQAQGLE